ncbi:HNH endonuclease [Leptolyngbya ohadii]|uniref:HNH endonuclease n=1 Tax=Leptolyngbya ohadii TaxID=1962290 RepID=UPI000B59AD7D|nr:HNH endonuclease [Leptolyngbya ohadii]
MNRRKADELSKAFGLEVVQSRYSDWGNFYGLVQSYPCALWDRSGYIIFNNEDELKIPGISIAKRINIPKGISALKGYKQIIHDVHLPEELPDGMKYQEGAVQQIRVNRYERDQQARNACLLHYGYVCQACNVKLSDVYGAIAETLIHIHHIKPLSEIGESYIVNPISDLISVCPNCHAVIHLRTPPYPPIEVRSMLNKDQLNQLYKTNPGST